MDAKWRFGATFIIWSFSFVLAIIAIIAASGDSLDDWVAIVPLGVALISTIAIWESATDDKKSSASSSRQKPDNTAYNMALLMEMMDDDERDEFKSQLKQRILSGESVTDASIIQEMEKRKRG